MEFVILAIPLFLPILIYISQFADVSAKEINGRNLVREVVRAYVTSEDLGQTQCWSMVPNEWDSQNKKFHL